MGNGGEQRRGEDKMLTGDRGWKGDESGRGEIGNQGCDGGG